MHLPLWFLLPFLPIYFWPVTLPLLLGLIWLAVRFRGRRRRLTLAGIAALVVPPLLAFSVLLVLGIRDDAQRRAERARTQSVLERETTFDGIAFPAGTRITWSTPAHTHWTSAAFPRPIDFHGLPLRGIAPQSGNWYVTLAAPTRISGWDCGENAVSVTGGGELVSCALSRTVVWKGWAVPALAVVRPHRDRATIDVSVPPYARTEEARGIGRPLPEVATLNDDGSLAGAYLRREDPVLVAGVPLWGNVAWRYDPATHGEGVDRPAIAVEGMRLGTAPEGEDAWRDETVLVSLPDGRVTPGAPGGR